MAALTGMASVRAFDSYMMTALPLQAEDWGLLPVCYVCMEDVAITITMVREPRYMRTVLELAGECCGHVVGDRETLDESKWNADTRRAETERAFWELIKRNGIVLLPETGAELERAFLETAIR